MCLIFLLLCVEFEGNLITCLCFMAVFCKCAKRREKKKKKEEMSNFLKAHISKMAGMIFLPQIWYALSPDMPSPAQKVQARDNGAKTHVKLYFAI